MTGDTDRADYAEDIQPIEPVADYESKKVMLRAERGDHVEIDGYGEMKVVRRTNTYFGPRLVLSESDDEPCYVLVAPGFAHQLELWQYVTDDEGWRNGLRRLEEVPAEIVETKQYDICACGEPLKGVEHQKQALMRVGEHG